MPVSTESFPDNVPLAQAKSDRVKFTFESAAGTGSASGNALLSQDKATQELLEKWGLGIQSACRLYHFNFTGGPWLSYQAADFLGDLFKDAAVLSTLKVTLPSGANGSMGGCDKEESHEQSHELRFTPISTTMTTMDVFDRVQDPESGVVRANGEIIKCFDEYTDDHIVVSDELRKCLVMPEYECYTLLSETDRSEFLVHVFRALCLGGALCQYEDGIKAYMDATRQIYKELVSVVKEPATGSIKVTSHVFRIDAVRGKLAELFPFTHPQNYCYVIVDPRRRTVKLWYHAQSAYY